jgi:ribosome-binding protein aMBF1 (putative translation factor)
MNKRINLCQEDATMPGPKPRYPIKLLDNQIAELRRLVNARKTSQVKVMRAKIILHAHEHPEWSNQEIAAQIGCSDRVVRKWRRRWVETQSLEDLPRPGAPRRFSP